MQISPSIMWKSGVQVGRRLASVASRAHPERSTRYSSLQPPIARRAAASLVQSDSSHWSSPNKLQYSTSSRNSAKENVIFKVPTEMSGPARDFFTVSAPFSAPLNGFQANKRVRVVGVPTSSANRFEVNFKCKDETLFQFCPRFNESCVVRNSTSSGGWQQEERVGGFPFRHGEPFTIEFLASGDNVKVSVNSNEFCTFKERLSFDMVKQVNVGGDIDLKSVHIYE